MSEFCPVCNTAYKENVTECGVCGFSDALGINRIWPVVADANYWLDTIVRPFRQEWDASFRRIVVDIGGSGVKLGYASDGRVTDIRKTKVDSVLQLANEIKAIAEDRVYGAAISVPGFVNSASGTVRLARVAPWAEGDLAYELKMLLKTEKIYLVNDGEAHALSLLNYPDIKYGAICLTIGTAVAFGVIGDDKKVIRPLSGESWDIGDFRLERDSWFSSYPYAQDESAVWWHLGSNGLNDLLSEAAQQEGANAYERFGRRLAGLLRQLTIIFQPGTIALTGGIIHGCRTEVENAIKSNLQVGNNIRQPEIFIPDEPETALAGLMNLLI